MKSILLTSILLMGVYCTPVFASDNDCPVGLVNGLTLDDEFGPGTAKITRCVKNTDKVKVVYQLNTMCKTAACVKPYALGNIENAIKDYEVTSGMVRGTNYEIVVVVHSGGWRTILDNSAAMPHAASNPFQAQMEAVLAKGVKVYFCQNTARGKNVKTANVISGVKFVTAGVTSIADFQLEGYSYVQP